MNERDIADLKIRARIAESLAGWYWVGGVIGTLIGIVFGLIVEASVPLSLGVLIGAAFVALGAFAGVMFFMWAEKHNSRSRSRGNRVA